MLSKVCKQNILIIKVKMGNYTSLQNECESVKRTIKPKGLVNEPLLQSLVTIERLVLEAIRFLDNCPLRGNLGCKIKSKVSKPN
jgi:hypothetical protein